MITIFSVRHFSLKSIRKNRWKATFLFFWPQRGPQYPSNARSYCVRNFIYSYSRDASDESTRIGQLVGVFTAYLCEKKNIIEPLHDKINKNTYAPSKESDQTWWTPSLIWFFAGRMGKQRVATLLNQCMVVIRSSWPRWMPKLIWVFSLASRTIRYVDFPCTGWDMGWINRL